MSDEKKNAPNVVVVGAGIIGVSTAYYLSKAGFNVAVVERSKDVALGTSYANAGRFCLSRVVNYPIAKPGKVMDSLSVIYSKAKRSLSSDKTEVTSGEAESPSKIEFSIPNMIFGYFFLKHAFTSKSEETNRNFTNLSKVCRQSMDFMFKDIGLEIGSGRSAVDRSESNVWLYGSDADYAAGKQLGSVAEENGYRVSYMDHKNCAQMYPFLRERINKLKNGGGCVVAQDDWTADARKYTKAVASAVDDSVSWHFNKTVSSLLLSKDKDGSYVTSGVRTENGEIFEADAVVLCCGPQTESLMKQVNGSIVPIAGMIGCTIDLYNVQNGPKAAIADFSAGGLNYQVSNFGDGRVRITGLAEFVSEKGEKISQECPNGVQCKEEYERKLISYTKNNYPSMTWTDQRKPWCGIRPITPDNLPILGLVPKSSNIYLNCGHGATGWTFSAGTSLMVANAVVNSLNNFSPSDKWNKYSKILQEAECNNLEPYSTSRFTWF